MESNARLVTTTNGTTALLPDIKKFFQEKTFVEFSKTHGKIQSTKPIDMTSIDALCTRHNLVPEGGIYIQKKQAEIAGGGCCPDCGAPVARIEGCVSCSAMCGYSKCS